MNAATPRIWLLLGQRTGDNNQVLALAEELGLPFETITLNYAWIGSYDVGRLPPKFLGATLLSLDVSTKAQIVPPWPDLVIGVGRRSVPVARYIRRMSGGRTRLVRVGNPRVDPRLFDLVVTTRQYDVPAADNVLTLPVAMSRFREPAAPGASERTWLDGHPRPHLLFAVGGNTKDVELPVDAMVAAAASMVSRARARGGTLLVAPSRRTESNLLRALKPTIEAHGLIVPEDGPRFAVLLGDADEIFVTADSISMLSEAVVTGKPVGMVPVRMTSAGLAAVGERKWPPSLRSPKRDPRAFWDFLARAGLVGTAEDPRSGEMDNPVAVAARAVRSLLGDAIGK